jgi:DtxR family Mn-dependent transcriptional regulator
MVIDAHTTESEEMYLIHIAMAGEEGVDGPVGLSRLAEMLEVSPVSANQMIKKLAARHLVDYVPYKGVELTSSGREIAAQVLRGRRLWALFLAEELGLSPVRADAIACDLEHVTTPDLADRLSRLLGDPSRGPQGRPIPPGGRDQVMGRSLPLSEVTAGNSATVLEVTGSPSTRSFLDGEGIVVGSEILVLAVGREGDCLVRTESGELHLAEPVATAVKVDA